MSTRNIHSAYCPSHLIPRCRATFCTSLAIGVCRVMCCASLLAICLSPLAGVRAAGVRATDVRVADVRATEVRATDVRATDVRATDVRATDVWATDVRASDVRATDVRTTDARASDVRASDVRAVGAPAISDSPPHDAPAVSNLSPTTQQGASLKQTPSTAPTRRPDGKKWRIGYVDSGDYDEYARALLGLVQALAQLDWLSLPDDIPKDLRTKPLWLFLTDNITSDYLEFVRDAWWQPADFDAGQRPALRQSIQNRLLHRQDIDLMIAMGTWAGQDMVTLRTPVPTVVAATSDPVRAHIIDSPTDSGLDNLHARVDPQRYQRQVRLFHDVIAFKRLGLVYEDSDEGKTYAALDAVQQVAQERGFTVVPCHAPANGISPTQATDNVLDCYRQLASNIDAAYVTVHRGITDDSIKPIAEILRAAHVPSFSMLGASEVQQGILLSLSQTDASHIGMFYAETIARIFNGAPARALNQIRRDTAKLAINLYTAQMIGFDPPVDTLLAADEIFQED